MGFFTIILWNVRRLNPKPKKHEDYLTYLEKLKLLYNSLKKYKPDIMFIIDSGYDLPMIPNTYDIIYTLDKRNFLLIKKKISYSFRHINDSTIMINNEYIFTYYTPNDKKKIYLLLNYIYNKKIFGDINIKSHHKINTTDHKYLGERNRTVIWNFKYLKNDYFKSDYQNIYIDSKFSDHNMLYYKINAIIKLINKKELENIKYSYFEKKSINKYTNHFINKWFYSPEKKIDSNMIKKKSIKDNIKKILLKIEKNKIDTWVVRKEKLKKWVNDKINFSLNSNTFRSIKKIMKYQGRETFEGTKTKNKYIEEFARFMHTSVMNKIKVNKEKILDILYKLANYIEELYDSNIQDNSNKLVIVNKTWNIFRVYNKINTTAADFNNINVYNVNKHLKKWLLTQTFNNSRYFRYPIEWIQFEFLRTKLIKIFEDTELVSKTFFLNKKKNLDSIDNFRIISIIPVSLKLFEEIFFHNIEELLQEIIDYNTDNKQYGFKSKSSTYMAITDVISSIDTKNKIVMLIDLSRAYETINKITLIREAINKCEEEFDKEKRLAWLLIKVWLYMVSQLNIQMNNKFIKSNYGVPMGSRWSPIIFNWYLSRYIREIKENYHCEIILYADDIILIDDYKEISHTIGFMEKTFTKANLKINFSKCEILYNNKNLNKKINLKILDLNRQYGFMIKNRARYLGKWISLDENNKVISSEDDLKNLGNAEFFRDLDWDNIMLMNNLYLTGKIRYNLINEVNNKRFDDLLKKIFKKVKQAKNIKRYNYMQLLIDINFTKLYLFRKLNKKRILNESYNIGLKTLVLKVIKNYMKHKNNKKLMKAIKDKLEKNLPDEESLNINMYNINKVKNIIHENIANYGYEKNDLGRLLWIKECNTEYNHLIYEDKIDMNNKFTTYILRIFIFLLTNYNYKIVNKIIDMEIQFDIDLDIIIKGTKFLNEYVFFNFNKLSKDFINKLIQEDFIEDKNDLQKYFKEIIFEEDFDNIVNRIKSNYKIEEMDHEMLKEHIREVYNLNQKKRLYFIEKLRMIMNNDKISSSNEESTNIMKIQQSFIKKIKWFDNIKNQTILTKKNSINNKEIDWKEQIKYISNDTEGIHILLLKKWKKVVNRVIRLNSEAINSIINGENKSTAKKLLDQKLSDKMINDFKKIWKELDNEKSIINRNKIFYELHKKRIGLNNKTYKIRIFNSSQVMNCRWAIKIKRLIRNFSSL